MKSGNIDRLLAMRDQAVKEQVAWHRANNKTKHSEKSYRIFEHAYSQGWAAAVNAAKLHGMIKK